MGDLVVEWMQKL